MAIPLIDWSLKSIVDYTIRTVQSNPEKYVREIFGDARTEPFSALYGDHFLNQIVRWISTTKVPVVLGFDLDPAQIPGVSIHLERSSPSQAFLADVGFPSSEPIEPYDREVLVPRFSPKNVVLSADGTYYLVTLPDTMSQDNQLMVVPGFLWRDAEGNEYGIGDDGGVLTLYPTLNGPAIFDGNFSSLEVISPISSASYQGGAMLYDESALITIHGHAQRSEGLWLWAIVQWGLLKFRPLLISTYGLDLGMPSASDFMKDDSFMGENIWRRFISLNVKAVWSWQGTRKQDVSGLILSALFARAGGTEEISTFSISALQAPAIALPSPSSPAPETSSNPYKVNYVILSAADEASKSLTLPSTPLVPSAVIIDIFGGGPMRYATDFQVTGSTISWAGGSFDGVLAENDELRVVYY